jgi:hypothetical protein
MTKIKSRIDFAQLEQNANKIKLQETNFFEHVVL